MKSPLRLGYKSVIPNAALFRGRASRGHWVIRVTSTDELRAKRAEEEEAAH